MWNELQKGSAALSLQVIIPITSSIFNSCISDCALDETCVLCEKCFNFDVHKDHNYWYTIGSNNSGSCDCGEDDSWRNDLKCSHHPSMPEAEASKIPQRNVECLRNLLRPVLAFVFESFHQYGTTRNEVRTDDCVLILYNDENHSFDDVIDILNTEIEVSVEDAETFATLVDTKVAELDYYSFFNILGIRSDSNIFGSNMCKIEPKV